MKKQQKKTKKAVGFFQLAILGRNKQWQQRRRQQNDQTVSTQPAARGRDTGATHGVTRKWQEQSKPAQSLTDLSILNKVEKWKKSKNTKAKPKFDD